MKIRNILLLTGLSVFMAACAGPAGSYFSEGDYPYDDGYYYDYRDTPSYEGYYYARIIFIGNVPYYVDDGRFIRPIPPRLYDHFRRYQYNTLGHPPMFSGDHEMRDGYPMSRIIYLDGVPYHVGNNRIAQPLPERLRPHFRYTPSNPGNAPANGNRPQPFIQHDNGGNNVPPGFGQDRGNDRNRDEHGPNGPNLEHMEQPPFVRGPREGGGDASADHEGRPAPFPDRRNLLLQQGQPNAGESHTDTANGKGPDRNRPQAVDGTGKKNTEKNIDKNNSSSAKKDKQDNSTEADDGGDNKKDSGKKLRNGKDDDQGGNDRSNGRRRD